MSENNDKKELLHCSFCGKSQDEVKKLTSSDVPEVFVHQPERAERHQK